MNQIAMRNSEKTFMLADSSKFGNSSHVAYASIENLHTVITDSKIDSDILEHLRDQQAQIVCVEET